MTKTAGGKWKLIDRCSDSGIRCSLCEENKADIAQRAGKIIAESEQLRPFHGSMNDTQYDNFTIVLRIWNDKWQI